jgi:hypothetical protein
MPSQSRSRSDFINYLVLYAQLYEVYPHIDDPRSTRFYEKLYGLNGDKLDQALRAVTNGRADRYTEAIIAGAKRTYLTKEEIADKKAAGQTDFPLPFFTEQELREELAIGECLDTALPDLVWTILKSLSDRPLYLQQLVDRVFSNVCKISARGIDLHIQMLFVDGFVDAMDGLVRWNGRPNPQVTVRLSEKGRRFLEMTSDERWQELVRNFENKRQRDGSIKRLLSEMTHSLD